MQDKNREKPRKLDPQITLGVDLEFSTPEGAQSSLSLLEEVRKMLNALRRSLA